MGTPSNQTGAVFIRLDRQELNALRDLARQERQRTGELVTPTGMIRDAARRLIETASRGGAR
jgi:hypothetical protein